MSADNDNPYGLKPLPQMSEARFNANTRDLVCLGDKFRQHAFSADRPTCANCRVTPQQFKDAGGHIFLPDPPTP